MARTVEQRRRTWIDFQDLSSPVNRIALVLYDYGQRPWPYPDRRAARMDWAVSLYERQLETAQWLDDDRVPAVNLHTGTEIFAEAFGCRVAYPGDNMPYALARVESAADVAKLSVPSVFDGPLGDIFDMTDRIRDRVGPDAVLHLPDIQSPFDIAALIWKKEDFLIALIDEPEAVHELVAMTRTLLTAFLDEWFRRYGTAYIAHYPDYYMEGGMTLSEDEIGAISPGFFRTYCLDSLNALSDRYGGIGIHSCANSRHQWEGFRDVRGLRMLNLIQPAPVLEEAYAFFAGQTAQMHSFFGELRHAPDWAGPGPDAHVVLMESASDRDSALRALERMRRPGARR
ncbi:MAG: hypothetical protein KBA30_03645 [Clostridia bacterium]|nr:hypothetical protein [Clostridia bacterium]